MVWHNFKIKEILDKWHIIKENWRKFKFGNWELKGETNFQGLSFVSFKSFPFSRKSLNTDVDSSIIECGNKKWWKIVV